MTQNYILLVQYTQQSAVTICSSDKEGKKYLLASEENKHLLVEIATRLMEDGLCYSWQLAQMVGSPTFAETEDEVRT